MKMLQPPIRMLWTVFYGAAQVFFLPRRRDRDWYFCRTYGGSNRLKDSALEGSKE